MSWTPRGRGHLVPWAATEARAVWATVRPGGLEAWAPRWPPGRGRQLRGAREAKRPLLQGCQMFFKWSPPPLGSKRHWPHFVDEATEMHKSK